MRVINEQFETIKDYDLELGFLVSTTAIREGAVPPDNIAKFAYDELDYEEVQMYVPYPVKTVSQKIAELKKRLADTDYKIIKCSECQLLGKELPYDIAEIHSERQAIRDEINELENQ